MTCNEREYYKMKMRSNTFIVKQMVKTVDGENRKLQIRRSQNTVEWWTDRQTDFIKSCGASYF